MTRANRNGALTTYTWDGENRLATVTLPGGSVTTFTYAANGLRRKTLVGGATKIFVWDHQNVLLETGSTGTTNAAYTQTPDQYGELVAQRRSGASSFYHFDALGSMTELTNSAQTVTDTWRYYAFGESKFSTGSTPNPFQFVGRLGYYTETTLGLQYLRARWYKPAAGRFLSTDPVGGANSYLYGDNEPVELVDPSGELPCPYLRAHGISGVPCEGLTTPGGPVDAYPPPGPEETWWDKTTTGQLLQGRTWPEGIRYGAESGWDECFFRCWAAYLPFVGDLAEVRDIWTHFVDDQPYGGSDVAILTRDAALYRSASYDWQARNAAGELQNALLRRMGREKNIIRKWRPVIAGHRQVARTARILGEVLSWATLVVGAGICANNCRSHLGL